MNLNEKQTNRGFALIEFQDRYDNKCSIQASSLATEAAIWFGIDDANPQIMASKTEQGGTGWVPYPIPEDVSLTTRMHLTQSQVEGLLPILEHFVKTGEVGLQMDPFDVFLSDMFDVLKAAQATFVRFDHDCSVESYSLLGKICCLIGQIEDYTISTQGKCRRMLDVFKEIQERLEEVERQYDVTDDNLYSDIDYYIKKAEQYLD